MKKTIFFILLLTPLLTLAGENTCVDTSGNFQSPSCAKTIAIKVAPTVDTAIYAAADAISTGLTFANAGRPGILTGRIKKVVVSDASGQGANLELDCFNVDMTATTDQAAFDAPDTEIDDAVAPISIATHLSYNTADTVISQSADVSVPYGPLASTSMECALVSRGTPDYVAGTDVTVTIYVERD